MRPYLISLNDKAATGASKQSMDFMHGMVFGLEKRCDY